MLVFYHTGAGHFVSHPASLRIRKDLNEFNNNEDKAGNPDQDVENPSNNRNVEEDALNKKGYAHLKREVRVPEETLG